MDNELFTLTFASEANGDETYECKVSPKRRFTLREFLDVALNHITEGFNTFDWGCITLHSLGGSVTQHCSFRDGRLQTALSYGEEDATVVGISARGGYTRMDYELNIAQPCEATVLVYSDMLLDDMCALEYLSTQYEKLVLVTVNEKFLESPYASSKTPVVDCVIAQLCMWFKEVTVLLGDSDYTLPDEDLQRVQRVYSLAPLTHFVSDLQKYRLLKYTHITIMAGEEHGPDGAGNEWNAHADETAYRQFFNFVPRYEQFTTKDCTRLYEQRGYQFISKYNQEYIDKMEALGESIVNFDLQAVIGR